ncbi:MFS transporter [Staphylococcus pettenkoferi]|uniref:MFS transporter n=1 Tax=Staphylococcus pettenkoferi TaxID=170573 RepID=UPI0011A86E48|nr:MFS transporter [Staphylococcus pettenkoferi]
MNVVSKYFERIVVFTAGMGMFLSTLDTGIINVALPTLVKRYHVDTTTITWTVTLYTLLLTGTIIVFGRLSDRYNRLNIYSIGLLVFLIASVLCGISTHILQLIMFRGLQGIGAAMLQGTATAIITTNVSEERQGSALGTLSIILGIGPVLGPSLGGLLLSIASWRWIFWINIPFVCLGLVGWWLLKKHVVQERNTSVYLDLRGNALLFISVCCLLQGLTACAHQSITNFSFYRFILISIIAFCVFVKWELKVQHPILNLRLFKDFSFSVSMLAILVFGGATSLGFIVPPYILGKLSHLSSWQIGIVNLASPLGLVLISKTAGKLMNRINNIILMSVGLGFMAIAYGSLGLFQSSLTPVLIFGLLFIYGGGGGLFLPSNTSTIMNSVSRSMQGTVGSSQRMVQNIGIALYTAITSLFIDRSSSKTILILGASKAWLFASLTILLTLMTFIVKYLKEIKEKH